MRKTPEYRDEEAPLYVRWPAEASPYAVELRLELVARIASEVRQAESAGIEIGGVLCGTFVHGPAPVLRIEEISLLPRTLEDGATFLLNAHQEKRFHELRRSSAPQELVAVGMFRSHLRSGPLQPAPADQSLLISEFPQPVYVLLLVNGREPYESAFFIAKLGQLPESPSVGNFRMKVEEFQGLPEMALEGAGSMPDERVERPRSKSSVHVLTTLAAILVIAAALWVFWRATSGREQFAAANRIGLTVVPAGSLVRISWDHSARAIIRANGGTLVIGDGPNRREIKLGPDELRLGTVDYEHVTNQIKAAMTLDLPEGTSPPESAAWPPRSY